MSTLSVKYYEEPLLDFRYGQQLAYPRDGLFLYGPVDGANAMPMIRYAAVGTTEGLEHLRSWSKSLNGFIAPPSKRAGAKDVEPQHVPFPGFAEAFGSEWPARPLIERATVDRQRLREALNIGNRNEAVKKAVDLFIEPILDATNKQEATPDFWFVVIPEEVYELGRPLSRVKPSERVRGEIAVTKQRAAFIKTNPTLWGDEEEEAEVYRYAPHFRRQLKARLLDHRVVTQLVRETTLSPKAFINAKGVPLRKLEDPATIAWKLATACYYKAGGRPWQLSNVRDGVCYVGLVYKRDDDHPDQRYSVCAAQMFLANGEGVVFRGALGPWYRPESKEFHLDAASAKDLISKVVAEYKYSFGGKAPRELFIHAGAAFSDEEWTGFQEASSEVANIVGVQIHDPRDGLKLFRPGEYPVIRGTALHLNERDAYLWTAGYAPRLDTYLGPETPNPIFVSIRRGEASLNQVLRDILGLTKVNFNSCLLYNRLPVTIKFANAIGDVLLAAPTSGEPKLPFKFYI
ncbi:MAG: hypothetical protein NW215_00650 [Hyphomicrobiales bacterium]|nr:hypothetical protein [Hyphomicrobiales bacterium]